MKTLRLLILPVLVCLVLVLSSCSSLKSDTTIASDLDKRIKESGLTNVDVRTTDRGVTITAGELNFPAESAEITPQTTQRLDALARLLKGYESKRVLIEGHTAAVGDAASQQDLSVNRARAVADYFVSKGVFKASQIVIEGKGGTVPLADTSTEEGKSKNRRGEITLLRWTKDRVGRGHGVVTRPRGSIFRLSTRASSPPRRWSRR